MGHLHNVGGCNLRHCINVLEYGGLGVNLAQFLLAVLQIRNVNNSEKETTLF